MLRATGVLALATLILMGCDGRDEASPSWGWKLATDVDDAHNFINGLGSYSEPHAVVSIAATESGFYMFYRSDLRGTSDWGWKLANTPEDAHSFLSSTGSYSGDPIDQAKLAYKAEGLLYVFYRGSTPQASWGWKRATQVDDMLNFINGTGAYTRPQEGTIGGLSDSEILFFYRNDLQGSGDWGWKLATTIDDAHAFLNGQGAYDRPVQDAKIFGAGGGHLYIFYRD